MKLSAALPFLLIATPVAAQTAPERFLAGLSQAADASIDIAEKTPGAETFVCAHYKTEEVKQPANDQVTVSASFRGAVVVMGGSGQLAYRQAGEIGIMEQGNSSMWYMKGDLLPKTILLQELKPVERRQIGLDILTSQLAVNNGINMPAGCQPNLLLKFGISLK